MSNEPAYLREQAARCRRLAKGVLDREGAARLIDLADYYERQADELAVQTPTQNPAGQVPARGGPQPA